MEPDQKNVAPQSSASSMNPIIKSHHMALIGFLIVLLVVGVGIGAYTLGANKTQTPQSTPTPSASQLSPTPTIDETANWKTYTNIKYDFEFRYPNDWGQMICSNIQTEDSFSFGPEFLKNSSLKCQTDIVPTAGFAIVDKNDIGPGYEISNKKTVLVGNENVDYLYIKNVGAPGPFKFINLFIPINGKYIALNLYDLTYEKIYDQILSTFKFLSPSPTSAQNQNIDASNWLIYNSRCEFSVKYPQDWKITDPPICGTLRAPNFTNKTAAENYGFFLRFSRWEKGTRTSTFNNSVETPIIINNLDDYIQSKRNDGTSILEIKNKIIGGFNGKSFTLSTPEGKYTNMIFEKGNYIYVVDYPVEYADNFITDINQILSTFKFTQ